MTDATPSSTTGSTLRQALVRAYLTVDPRSLGLGLHIVRQIALAHEGDVSVKSSAQEGTCFTVRWPRGAK